MSGIENKVRVQHIGQAAGNQIFCMIDVAVGMQSLQQIIIAITLLCSLSSQTQVLLDGGYARIRERSFLLCREELGSAGKVWTPHILVVMSLALTVLYVRISYSNSFNASIIL